MWALAIPWWEVILRVTLIYAALLALVRISGKRQIGQLTPMDLLTVLLVSELVAPALTANDTSVTAGLLGSATLFAVTIAISVVSYRWPRVENVLEGVPRTVIYQGELQHKVMRRERITDQDLSVALHEGGVESVEEVRLGIVEPNGRITIVPY